MKKLLFLDACISTHDSRTKKLCDVYLEEFLKSHPDTEMETVVLRKGVVEPLTEERLAERDDYVVKKDWSHPMFDLAKQFKNADYIVLGTPYWDLSFASIVKVYIENIVVADLTFEATDTGFIGLCNGKKLVYITTAGGFVGNKNYGYDYLCGMADMLGAGEPELVMAEALDIVGYDADKIVADAIRDIRKRF